MPFKLPATMEVLYGDKVVTVEVEGNYLLIPIEGEIERVCISDFDVREIRDGQIVLESEINPWMVLRVTLGLIKFGYYAYRELTTRHFDHAEVKRWLYGNSSPVYAEFDLFRGRAEQLAKVQFKELTVSVGVRDLDHGEKVIAYLIGEKTGEKIKLDREFPTIGDRVIGATMLRVKGADMSPVCIFLRENEGRVTVKLEKESWGAVWIEGVTLGIDW
ncbi:hypothetical protein M1N06_04860 [Peptococcaceae bacterium]|nr:hypothetical protein [Peptococcaceae bacterium]